MRQIQIMNICQRTFIIINMLKMTTKQGAVEQKLWEKKQASKVG